MDALARTRAVALPTLAMLALGYLQPIFKHTTFNTTVNTTVKTTVNTTVTTTVALEAGTNGTAVELEPWCVRG